MGPSWWWLVCLPPHTQHPHASAFQDGAFLLPQWRLGQPSYHALHPHASAFQDGAFLRPQWRLGQPSYHALHTHASALQFWHRSHQNFNLLRLFMF
jgi:hypothetical protein